MLRPFSFLLLLFCTCSLTSRADNGQPGMRIRFSQVSITREITDSVPPANPPETGDKEAGIKEVPKARKQLKPVALGIAPAVKSLPVVKPIIKPVIRPVIKPVIRIR